MKKLSLFILLISLHNAIANACSNENDRHYYMFSVYHQNSLMEKTSKQNIKFWSKYTGGRVNETDVTAQLENTGDSQPGSNKLQDYLKTKRDNNAVEYLEQLKVMKKAASINKNKWDYPTKAQIETAKDQWKQCMNWAVSKLQGKSNSLYARYVLMAMRGAFYSGNKAKMAEIWTEFGPKVKDNDLKTQCEGYMANEWLANGLTEKAREFYVKAGNIADLRATFPSVIKANDIKTLYSKYPNSVAFPFMLQDYLNSMDSDLNPKFTSLGTVEKAMKDSATIAELTDFAKFASDVAANNQVKLQSLWKSVEGYALYLCGKKQEALNAYYASLKMKVPQRVAYNTRALILLARTESEDYTEKFNSYVAKEITWLINTAKKEKPFAQYAGHHFRNHYTDVLEHIVIDILSPNYVKAGNIQMAALLCNATDEVVTVQNIYDRNCTLIPRDSTKKGFNGDYSGYQFALLDTVSVDGVINYYTVLNGGGTQTEQTLLQLCRQDLSYVAEIIGTKLMREFKFKSAMDYLKKAPSNFVNEQNIKPYLAYQYTTPIWMGYNQTITEKQKKKAATAKMDFCKYMLKLEGNFEKMKAKAKPVDPKLANVAYALATAYAQTSYRGRCWAMTSYSYSSAVDSAKATNDAYIKRAKAMLRAAYAADSSADNQVRCLAGLSFLGGKQSCLNSSLEQVSISDNDLDRYIKLLLRYDGTAPYEKYNVGRCDIINDYLANQSN